MKDQVRRGKDDPLFPRLQPPSQPGRTLLRRRRHLLNILFFRPVPTPSSGKLRGPPVSLRDPPFRQAAGTHASPAEPTLREDSFPMGKLLFQNGILRSLPQPHARPLPALFILWKAPRRHSLSPVYPARPSPLQRYPSPGGAMPAAVSPRQTCLPPAPPLPQNFPSQPRPAPLRRFPSQARPPRLPRPILPRSASAQRRQRGIKRRKGMSFRDIPFCYFCISMATGCAVSNLVMPTSSPHGMQASTASFAFPEGNAPARYQYQRLATRIRAMALVSASSALCTSVSGLGSARRCSARALACSALSTSMSEASSAASARMVTLFSEI